MLTKIKRHGALLATAAVICATVALVPQTASANASIIPNAGSATDVFTAPANRSATGSACPTGSAPAAGFTDTTSTDVDCIKMYGITQGTTATTYEPDGSIPRWQMALFLNRMFVPMGVAAAGTTTVPAFTDTADLSAEIQAAITAIASHGITVGTTATTFGPNENVTREQMALFLYRLGEITKLYNAAAVDARGIWHNTLANDVASGTYNYSDVNNLQLESLEAIASLYNAGVTGETCTANGLVNNPTGGCASTYRPADNITRAEMATMIVGFLGHTNARPAGVTMQSLESLATAGAKNIRISVRNDDFTPSQNTSVDHFHDPTQLTTAAALAANAPFLTTLNTVSSSVTSAVGTAGTVDSLDLKTNSLGNVNGQGLTTAANSTTKWWAWTAPAGTIYVDGSTTGVATLEAVLGAADSTAYATRTTYSISGSNALGQALVEDYGTGQANVTADDGIKTIAGGTRTLTATMDNSALTTAGTAHTVVDGYTFNFSVKKVDMLGNVTISSNYVPSSGGSASYVVTCDADNSATVNADGAGGGSYWQSYEVTVSEATALGAGAGISRPALSPGAATAAVVYPTDGGDNNTLNVSCDDEVRAYTAGTTGNTLTISQNTVIASTAGSLVSITTTAYDQYGDGIAGVTSRIMKAQTAATGGAGAAAQQAILTSTSNGSATLSMVLCNSSFNGTQAFSVNTTGATMSNIAATEAERSAALDAGAGANGEGTTVYCAAAGTDATSSPGAVTGVPEQQTVTLSAAFNAGDFVCTYTDAAGTAQTTALFAGNGANTLFATRLNDLTNLSGVSAALAGQVYTVTFAANTGDHAIMSCDGTTGTALTTGGGGAITLAVAETVKGVAAVAQTFVDEDAAGNTMLTLTTVTSGIGADGAAAPTRAYRQWTYDGTDVFMLDGADGEVAASVQGASEAQFDAAMGVLTGASGATPVSIQYRTAATGSQVSVFNIGS